MSTDSFKDREKGFEGKYHLDQELEFKINARRDKLMGLWVAEQIGKSGGGAESYAKELVIVDLDEPGDDDIVGRIMADLDEHEVDISEGRIRIKLGKYHEEARKQIMAEVAAGTQHVGDEE